MSIVDYGDGAIKVFNDALYEKLIAEERKFSAASSFEPNGIVIHFADTSWDCTAAEVNAWHKARGFTPRGSGPYPYMGYHGLVRADGTIEVGRTLDVQGTQCLGYNTTTYGLCFSGDFGGEWPTPAQYDAAANWCRDRMNERGFSEDRIWRHDQLNSTNCPGRLDINYLKDKIRGGGIVPKVDVKQIDLLVAKGKYRGIVIVDGYNTTSALTFNIKFPEGCGFASAPLCFLSQPNGANWGANIGTLEVRKDGAVGGIVEKPDAGGATATIGSVGIGIQADAI